MIFKTSKKFEKAKNLVRENNLLLAQKIFEELIKEEPSSEILNDAGVIYYLLDDWDRALELFDNAKNFPNPCIFSSLNKYYLEKAKKIKENTDLKLIPKNYKGSLDNVSCPKISVIVRTYNRMDLLKDALNSIKQQTFNDFETIIINDGGDKRAKEIAETINPPRLRYFYAPHGGPSTALNRGLEMARGKYIAFLDDDDLFYPTHLEKLSKVLDQNKDISLVYPDVIISEWEGKKCVSKRKQKIPDFNKELLIRTNIIPSVLVVVRSKCFLKTGKFIKIFQGSEDWEMWLRLSKFYNFYHLPEITAEIREFRNKERVTEKELSKKFFWDNLILFLHKGITLFSFPYNPKLEKDFETLKQELTKIINDYPELFNKIDLRKIYFIKNIYAFFYDQARWFIRQGKMNYAKIFLKTSLRFTKFEPKIYMKMLSVYLKKFEK